MEKLFCNNKVLLKKFQWLVDRKKKKVFIDAAGSDEKEDDVYCEEIPSGNWKYGIFYNEETRKVMKTFNEKSNSTEQLEWVEKFLLNDWSTNAFGISNEERSERVKFGEFLLEYCMFLIRGEDYEHEMPPPPPSEKEKIEELFSKPKSQILLEQGYDRVWLLKNLPSEGDFNKDIKKIIIKEKLSIPELDTKAIESGMGEKITLPKLILKHSMDLTNSQFTQLPNGLQIEGDLNLQNSKSLIEIPSNLKVGGRLIVIGCKNLKRVGANVCVFGNCIFENCSRLNEFHEQFRVYGDLKIKSCKLLETLPPKLYAGVEGQIKISDCRSLISIPAFENSSINGDFSVLGCSALKELPVQLDVAKKLDLSGSGNLISLPEHVSVGTDLILQHCSKLKSIDMENPIINGKCDITHCTALEAVSLVQVNGMFEADGCKSLKSMEQLKFVLNTLDLTKCAQLTSLPDGLEIGGDLILSFCKNLKALPNNLSVGKSVILEYCTSLEDLGGLNLSINGDLNLYNCISLRKIPENLQVSGTLNMSYCKSIVELPMTGIEGGTINLSHCNQLESLPENLKFQRDLHLDHCEHLCSLPGDVTNWGSGFQKMNDSNRVGKNVYMSSTRLSMDQLDWLQQLDIPDVIFHISLDFANEDYTFENFDQATEFWIAISKCKEKKKLIGLEDVIPRNLRRGVLVFLSKLRGAKEFIWESARTQLAQRVVGILESFLEDPCEEILIRMADSVDACDDKPIWALNQMSVIEMVSKARGDREKLEEIGKRIMYLDIVHQHAKRKVEKLGFVDDVCVYLKFEIELMDSLDLPVTAVAMHFPNYMKISDQEIENAKLEALNTTDEQFQLWLQDWSEWKQQERYEIASKVNWNNLQTFKVENKRQSMKLNMVGEEIEDIVYIHNNFWSLNDLLKHWIKTGLDLNNSPLLNNEIENDLKAVKI